MSTISTTLHAYRFDLNRADEKAAYAALRARLQAEPGRGRLMDSFGDYHVTGPKLDGRTVELETAFLFDNQWNSAPIEGVTDKGLRLFDWAETANEPSPRYTGRDATPKNIRAGYYLDITPEIVALRASRLKCGYCGKQYEIADAPADGFCSACIGSEYLKEADLRLLRLRPVSEGLSYKAPELSEDERAALLPRYVEAQIYGQKARDEAQAKAERAKVDKLVAEAEAKAVRLIDAARRERDGMLWLLDRGFSVANVIYYGHTGRFHFGWRGDKGLSDSVVAKLLEVIGDFPAPYDISTDPKGMHGGRKLSGD